MIHIILINIWQIRCINKDGTITFEDGFCIEADVIFYCTGYEQDNIYISKKDRKILYCIFIFDIYYHWEAYINTYKYFQTMQSGIRVNRLFLALLKNVVAIHRENINIFKVK